MFSARCSRFDRARATRGRPVRSCAGESASVRDDRALRSAGRAVALVRSEAVVRIERVQTDHHLIARDFGEYRGCTDADPQGIAIDDRLKGAVAAAARQRKDSDCHRTARGAGQIAIRQCAAHREVGRLQDVERVDLLDVRPGHRPRERIAPDLDRELLALLGLETFESRIPRTRRLGSRITAAATTGPASGPRPASSTPATRPGAASGSASDRARISRIARRSFSHLSSLMPSRWRPVARCFDELDDRVRCARTRVAAQCLVYGAKVCTS